MSASEPSYTQLKTTNLPWYTEDIGAQLTPETRAILENYSNIPPAEVEAHIRTVRQKLWDLRGYPCTGLFVFLVPWIKYHAAFPGIVDSLRSKEDSAILDVGSYVGHDLRALHWAGVPLSSLHGLDIISFADLGWEFFNDRDKFNVGERLLIGDILDESATSPMAEALDGQMDVIWCSAVLHQFPWSTAVRACKRLVRLSRGPQSVIFGAQVGSKEGEGKMDMKAVTEQMAEDTKPFKHNASSFERMWRQVGDELGVDLEAKAVWKDWEDFGCEKERCKIMGPDIGVLEWTIRLL